MRPAQSELEDCHANDVVWTVMIPFVLMHLVSPRQIRHVRHAVESLCAVLNRFCNAYPEDERLQEELGPPPSRTR